MAEPVRGSISIAMTTYNGEKYLAEQLASLDAQTRRPLEVIISDDGSSDGTWPLLEAWAASTDLSVTLVRNPQNLGFIRNFEATVSRCSGDYIALCDQDDIWRADKLERLAAALDAHPTVNLAFSDANLIDSAGRLLHVTAFESLRLDPVVVSAVDDAQLRCRLQTAHTVIGATAMYRRSWNEIILPYPESLSDPDSWWIHDGWTSALLSVLGNVHAASERLVDYRIHAGQAASLILPGGWEDIEFPPDPTGHRNSVIANLKRELGPLEQISRRLQESALIPVAAQPAAQEIIRKAAFLSFRIDPPRRPVKRVVEVAKQAKLGNYRDFARGLRSIIADVLLR